MDDLSQSKDNQPIQIDWKKIIEILCGIGSSLQVVCNLLPKGLLKDILCGMASFLMMICHQLSKDQKKDA